MTHCTSRKAWNVDGPVYRTCYSGVFQLIGLVNTKLSSRRKCLCYEIFGSWTIIYDLGKNNYGACIALAQCRKPFLSIQFVCSVSSLETSKWTLWCDDGSVEFWFPIHYSGRLCSLVDNLLLHWFKRIFPLPPSPCCSFTERTNKQSSTVCRVHCVKESSIGQAEYFWYSMVYSIIG